VCARACVCARALSRGFGLWGGTHNFQVSFSHITPAQGAGPMVRQRCCLCMVSERSACLGCKACGDGCVGFVLKPSRCSVPGSDGVGDNVDHNFVALRTGPAVSGSTCRQGRLRKTSAHSACASQPPKCLPFWSRQALRLLHKAQYQHSAPVSSDGRGGGLVRAHARVYRTHRTRRRRHAGLPYLVFSLRVGVCPRWRPTAAQQGSRRRHAAGRQLAAGAPRQPT